MPIFPPTAAAITIATPRQNTPAAIRLIVTMRLILLIVHSGDGLEQLYPLPIMRVANACHAGVNAIGTRVR